MYEDDPQDKVFDVLGEAVFGDHPLGRAIIGRAEVVARHAGRRACARSTRARYVPAQRRGRGRGLGRPRRARRAGRSAPAASASAARAPALPARRPTPQPPACASSRKDTEQYHVCLGAPGHRARRRPPLRAARARQHPRRHVVLAAVPGGAREARPGLLGLLVPVALRRHRARSACTSARARTTSPRRCAWSADELERLREEPATAEELAALQGERQGPRVLVAGVDDGAHEPARLLGAGRHAAAERRRGRRAHRRGDARRPRASWPPSCSRPSGCSAAGIGRRRGRRSARRWSRSARGRVRGMIRVAVAGAAGRMGQTVCDGRRGRRRHGARRRAPTRRSASPLADVLGDADVRRRLHHARHGARQRARLRRAPACTS